MVASVVVLLSHSFREEEKKDLMDFTAGGGGAALGILFFFSSGHDVRMTSVLFSQQVLEIIFIFSGKKDKSLRLEISRRFFHRLKERKKKKVTAQKV